MCYSDFVFLSPDIRLQICRNHENRVRGPWKSLKMAPFDRKPMTFYWCSIVTIALSRVVSEIFNVEKIATLKSQSGVNQGHWKWYHSIDWVWFPLVFYSNFVHKIKIFWDIRLQKCRDFEKRLEVRQGHWRYQHSIERIWLPIDFL